MKDWAKVVALVCLLAGLCYVPAWLAFRNYRECRRHGFTFLYCVR